MQELGKKIKKLRTQKNLTQTQLAQRLWVTKALISAYEAGTKFPSLDMLVKLAYSFHVSTDYLLGIDKKQSLDITNLTETQINILKNLISEFEGKNS